MKVFIEHGHSRLPVYEESLDNIVGVLYVKDTLKHLIDAELSQVVGGMMRKPLFIPETIFIPIKPSNNIKKKPPETPPITRSGMKIPPGAPDAKLNMENPNFTTRRSAAAPSRNLPSAISVK